MRRLLPLICCMALPWMLLCSCSQPVNDGAYRVETQQLSNHHTSLSRKYIIETASLRRVVLADRSGSNSTSIAPNSITNEKTAQAEVTVNVELEELNTQARITIKMVVKTESMTSRSEETMVVPSESKLASILEEQAPTGTLTSATTLLQLTSGEDYLQIAVE